MVAELWASDLQLEWQAVRETSRRKRKRRMARHVLQRGVVHLGGEGANLIDSGQAPLGQPALGSNRGREDHASSPSISSSSRT